MTLTDFQTPSQIWEHRKQYVNENVFQRAYWSLKIYWRQKTQCRHLRATERKWLDSDRTPMVSFNCPDCGLTDSGHVHANPDTWVKS